MTDRAAHGILGAILIAGFAFRLVAVPLVHGDGYTSDEREYIHLANRLQSGQGFVDSNGDSSVRAPLFPAILSLVLGVTDGSLAAAHVLNCLLGTLLVGLVYLLSGVLVPDRRAALLAAGAAAFYPGLVTYSALLQTETLGLVFLVLALLSAVRCIEEVDPLPALFLGVWIGCAALTRAVFLGLFPFLLLSMWWFRRKDGWAAVRPVLTALVVALMVLVPWTVRNGRIHGAIVPVSSGGGGSLLTGNNPHATGGWRLTTGFEEWFVGEAEKRGVPNPNILREFERNRLSRVIALEYMWAHPGATLLLALRKSYIFWVYPITHSDSNVFAQAVAVAGDMLLLAGVAIGIVSLRKPSRGLLLAGGLCGAVWLIHAVLHAEARFRLPVIPILVVVWGYGVATMLSTEGRRSLLAEPGRRRLLILLLLGIGVVYAVTGFLFFQGSI